MAVCVFDCVHVGSSGGNGPGVKLPELPGRTSEHKVVGATQAMEKDVTGPLPSTPSPT